MSRVLAKWLMKNKGEKVKYMQFIVMWIHCACQSSKNTLSSELEDILHTV